jgi:two-component system, NtrC family, nitrogen regulation sensor histidine kinase NtrY
MELTNFRTQVLLRALVFTALALVLAWSIPNTHWLVTPILCGLLMMVAIIDLIRYVEGTSRDLGVFLAFAAKQDFSIPYVAPRKGRIFAELQEAYRRLACEFRRLNFQKTASHQHLEAVVQHVGVALCCFDEHGDVTMFNEPGRRLLGIPHLPNLRSFARIDPRLPEVLERLGDNDRTLLEIRRGEETLRLMVYSTTFERLQQRFKLVSFQNIRAELDQQEIESWQKIIRVLTHEIMNSVTPIISLSRLLRDTLIDDSSVPPRFRPVTAQEQDDMLRGIAAIHTRGSGLLDFVSAYRSFARAPDPLFSDVDVHPLLARVRTLVAHGSDASHIAIDLHCDGSGLRIHVDARQIEQVLINLLRNAVEALTEISTPRIELRAVHHEGSVLLQVLDNGTGIAAEHLDSIFVPFFTTKRGGSGVGLSISRQLVQANRGLISVRSTAGKGCMVTLRFPEAPQLPESMRLDMVPLPGADAAGRDDDLPQP